MHFRIVSFIACVGSLFSGLSTQAAYSKISLSVPDVLSANRQLQPKQLSWYQLRDRAQAITVKVLAEQGWGSGILIQKQGQFYTVVTNEHVLRLGNAYRIQTPDGKIYSASKNTNAQFKENDLALLNFKSANSYQTATLATSPITIGDVIFAAGFPAEGKDLVFTTGQVNYLLPQAFLGGYQIGYSNDIVKGMSGGPVLNGNGEVVAINGKHKNPLWGNTYIFKDGSTPVVQVRRQMDDSSWAVPIQTFLQLAPQFAHAVVVQPKLQQTSPVVPIPNPIIVEPAGTNTQKLQRHPGPFW